MNLQTIGKAALAGLLLASVGRAGLSTEIVKTIRSAPLRVPPIERALAGASAVVCGEIIVGVNYGAQSLTVTKAEAPQALVEASIQIDKLAEKIFALFPPKTVRMAARIFEETDYVEYLPQLDGVSRSGFLPNATSGKLRATVHLNRHLTRSLIYKKTVLFYESLRLALRWEMETYDDVLDHYIPNVTLSDEMQLEERLTHLRLFVWLVQKLVMDQIPYEYYEADLKLYVVNEKFREICRQDVQAGKQIPLDAFFASRQVQAALTNTTPEQALSVWQWYRSID